MFTKDTKRAVRRAAKQRMRAKAIRVYYFHTPEQAAKYADNLKTCSRFCCGNRRRYEGLSLKEKAFMQGE